MGYLDGVKRSIDDPAFAMKINSQYTKITDTKLLEDSHQEGVKVWNKDMTVDPAAIKVVLEQSTVPKAAELDLKRFYDNSLIGGQPRLRVEVVSGRGEMKTERRPGISYSGLSSGSRALLACST